ncbi:MAG: hypothetical protein C0P78_009975, partial [Bacillota bacterium]
AGVHRRRQRGTPGGTAAADGRRGGGIASLPTHHEPAAYIGSAGETVLLIVSRRRCLGWIETDGRRLVIPRPDKLPRS